MILVALILVTILAGGLGSLGGRWLVRRDLGDYLEDLRRVRSTTQAATGRANEAAAVLESADLPAVLERLENMDSQVRGWEPTVQEAKRKADDVIQRQDALEQAIAGSLNITVRA